MDYIVDAKEMEAIDAYTIDTIGIPQAVLMERAALSVVSAIEERFGKNARILVVSGSGNNGGDGVAAARILTQRGYDAELFVIPSNHCGSAAFEKQLAIAKACGVKMAATCDPAGFDVVCDAIFGTGLSREVTGVYADVIKKISSAKGVRIAVDIPSGIDAGTGEVLGTAFCADLTVTFGYRKKGLLLSEGEKHAGEVSVFDIGFPGQAAEHAAPRFFTYRADEVERMLPVRRRNSNKGSYGKAAIIAGSPDMAGAALLSGEACYRMGTGLLMICTSAVNREIVQTKLPEAVLCSYDHEDPAGISGAIDRALSFADVCVLGPGLSTKEFAEQIVRQVLESYEGKLVIDADAINILSKHRDWLSGAKAEIILTPHIKEMSRLTGLSVDEIKKDMFRAAGDCANTYKCVTVLKDYRTVVSDGNSPSYMNLTGNDGMATGGSGDVLTGVIAGLLAGGISTKKAAELGVYLHGEAGDAAAGSTGRYGMLAGDMIKNLRRISGQTNEHLS